MATQPNEAAFPMDFEHQGYKMNEGLTKLELMTIEFTKAFLSNSSITEHHRIDGKFYSDTARQAKYMAEALIKELNNN